VTVIAPTALASGSFVIGDENATIGKTGAATNERIREPNSYAARPKR
jgi:hypothetical protein